LKEPTFRNRIVGMGIDPVVMPPDEFADYLRKEVPRWKSIVEEAGLKAE
jgi:tripartite-type tricarboxylate transporter receptor subunit TctC